MPLRELSWICLFVILLVPFIRSVRHDLQCVFIFSAANESGRKLSIGCNHASWGAKPDSRPKSHAQSSAESVSNSWSCSSAQSCAESSAQSGAESAAAIGTESSACCQLRLGRLGGLVLL